MEIHYLNVKEGDCSIIKHDSGRISMVDICCGNLKEGVGFAKKALGEGVEGFSIKGNFKQKEYPVNPILWLNDIANGRIFRFILTHPDMDHLDGIKALFESKFKPHNFWDTNNDKQISDSSSFGKYSPEDWKFYDEQLRAKSLKDVFFLRLHDGQKGKYYNCNNGQGEGFGDRIEILSPSEKTEEIVEYSGNVNDISYVLLMQTALGRKVLFCGDTEEDAWNEILRRHQTKVSNVDILFPPHHGRKSGGNDNFLDVLKPKITIFGNAKAEYLDYDSWNSRKFLHFTNNQIGSVVFVEDKNMFDVYATGKSFIAKWRSAQGWRNNTENSLIEHPQYHAWYLFSI